MSHYLGRRILLSSSAILSSMVWIEAAQSQAVQLPQITVNAPSPIQRAPAARPIRRCWERFPSSPISSRPSPWSRGKKSLRSPGTTLGDLLSNKPGNHRLGFRARRRQPSDRARPRHASRPRAGKRHRIERRVRTGRGSRHSDRSAVGAADRSDPRTGNAALGLAGDRRRGQRGQQSYSHRGSAARIEHRIKRRVELGRQRPGRVGAARRRQGQFRRCMPTPMGAKPAIIACRAIRICSIPTRPFNGRQVELVAALRRTGDRRLVSLHGRFCRRVGVAVQQHLSHPRHRRRGHTTRAST